MVPQHHIDAAKAAADTASIGAAGLWVGHAMGILTTQIIPPLAAFASLIYMLIRIYETKTVQGWVARIKRKKDNEPRV